MPYSKQDYPASMKNLLPDIREKAIEILNALIDEKEMNLEIAIPTAISRAKDWLANRNRTVPDTPTDSKKHGQDIYVTPHAEGWAIKKEKNKRVSFIFKKKIEAVSKARSLARRNHGSLIIQRKNGTIRSKLSYNQS
ncbi:DUF2188 domain-containing protein [Draconibacterium halophilum]|uniref:DUF2188 domain-containing protein n=1 Tax=Draconibacterium halophilum TaxID=2706887 RepID=A0A6C0RG15_9BACT|nr:DUF2188 domain-containing protein [Draconibacterium halophilum]QIA09079.1 DUF2188 domain-containing protein [Draconibacterium halophilum]